MILVTGAGGKTGRTIISKLVETGVATRAWVRQPEACPAGAEPFIGDMQNSADWEKACVGTEKIYLVCPNMHPAEVEIGRMALAAATNAGIEHIVYHSVLHPQTQEMPHHWNKLQVEELIFASGLPFTILQPTAYMQNLIPQLASVKKDGILRLPYPAESRISLIDLNDVAQAAVSVLTSDKFVGATLELVGTDPLSQLEVARMLSDWADRPVTFAEILLDAWEADNLTLAEYPRQTLLAMFRYYAQHGLIGNQAVLRMILEREPTDLATWLAQEK